MSPPKTKAIDEAKGYKAQIVVALIAAMALIISAYIGLQSAREPVLIIIGATQTKESILTSIPLTSKAVNASSTEIIQQLTATSVVNSGLDEASLLETATAIAKQAVSVQSTQTAIALSPLFIKGTIKSDFPSPSINVRSYPGLPSDNSNIVGFVIPGDKIIITGWTKASWTWYQIDVPSRNITGWISGRISINDQVYDSIVLEGNISVLPTSLFIDITDTTTP